MTKFSNRKIPKLNNPRGLSKVQKKQTVQLAKKVVNRATETKYVFDNDSQVLDDQGQVFALVNPSRGTDVNDFTGARIEPSYLQFEGTLMAGVVNGGSATANQLSQIRIVFFQWRPDTVSDTPSLGELFQTTTAPYTMSFYNPDYKSQFKVLKDIRTYVVASAGNPHSARRISFSIPGKKLSNIHFNSGAVSGENLIYCAIWSSEPNATNVANKPQLIWRSKTSYKDA